MNNFVNNKTSKNKNKICFINKVEFNPTLTEKSSEKNITYTKSRKYSNPTSLSKTLKYKNTNDISNINKHTKSSQSSSRDNLFKTKSLKDSTNFNNLIKEYNNKSSNHVIKPKFSVKSKTKFINKLEISKKNNSNIQSLEKKSSKNSKEISPKFSTNFSYLNLKEKKYPKVSSEISTPAHRSSKSELNYKSNIVSRNIIPVSSIGNVDSKKKTNYNNINFALKNLKFNNSNSNNYNNFPNNNINISYSELAKHLYYKKTTTTNTRAKNSNNTSLEKSHSSIGKITKQTSSFKILSTNAEKENLKDSKDNILLTQEFFNYSYQKKGKRNSTLKYYNNNYNNIKNSSTNLNTSNSNSNIIIPNLGGSYSFVNSKTTKDNSIITGNNKIEKMYNNKCNSPDIEGPEALHFFYVNILQSNKNLAYKFENCEDDNFFLNEFDNTNTFA